MQTVRAGRAGESREKRLREGRCKVWVGRAGGRYQAKLKSEV